MVSPWPPITLKPGNKQGFIPRQISILIHANLFFRLRRLAGASWEFATAILHPRIFRRHLSSFTLVPAGETTLNCCNCIPGAYSLAIFFFFILGFRTHGEQPSSAFI